MSDAPDSSDSKPIRFGCTLCGTRLRVDPSSAGKAMKCPSCGDLLRVPVPPPNPPASVAENPATLNAVFPSISEAVETVLDDEPLRYQAATVIAILCYVLAALGFMVGLGAMARGWSGNSPSQIGLSVAAGGYLVGGSLGVAALGAILILLRDIAIAVRSRPSL